MVGTQRRYHPLYRRIGRHLYDVHAKTGHGVTFVQSLTNDGLWNDREAYATGGFYDPATTGGGKLINTGYHLLDTVPWLLRHCQQPDGRASDVARIRYADVFAQFFTPDDTVGLVHNGGPGLNGGRPAPMNEINACLQVAFRDADDRTICLWQLGALHEGISARRSPSARVGEGEDPAGAGRTKQDVLTLYQGPVAAVWMRRIAKLLPTDGVGLGESGHAELICAQNAHLTGADGALEQVVGPYVDTDTAPTEEFLAALLGVTRPTRWRHRLATRRSRFAILAAAYESAVTGRRPRLVRCRRVGAAAGGREYLGARSFSSNEGAPATRAPRSDRDVAVARRAMMFRPPDRLERRHRRLEVVVDNEVVVGVDECEVLERHVHANVHLAVGLGAASFEPVAHRLERGRHHEDADDVVRVCPAEVEVALGAVVEDHVRAFGKAASIGARSVP